MAAKAGRAKESAASAITIAVPITLAGVLGKGDAPSVDCPCGRSSAFSNSTSIASAQGLGKRARRRLDACTKPIPDGKGAPCGAMGWRGWVCGDYCDLILIGIENSQEGSSPSGKSQPRHGRELGSFVRAALMLDASREER